MAPTLDVRNLVSGPGHQTDGIQVSLGSPANDVHSFSSQATQGSAIGPQQHALLADLETLQPFILRRNHAPTSDGQNLAMSLTNAQVWAETKPQSSLNMGNNISPCTMFEHPDGKIYMEIGAIRAMAPTLTATKGHRPIQAQHAEHEALLPYVAKVEQKFASGCTFAERTCQNMMTSSVPRQVPPKIDTSFDLPRNENSYQNAMSSNAPLHPASRPMFEHSYASPVSVHRPMCSTSLASLDLAFQPKLRHYEPRTFSRPLAPELVSLNVGSPKPSEGDCMGMITAKEENAQEQQQQQHPEVTMEEFAEMPDDEYLRLRSQLPGGNLPDPKPFKCDCPPEAEECGPFYIHMGHASSIQELRAFLEANSSWKGRQIRFEKISATKKEGKNSVGCPIAKWVIRRSGVEEKLLVVVKHRPHHVCKYAWLVAGYAVWEGIPRNEADFLYSLLSKTLPDQGRAFNRKCGMNQKKTCACQGTSEGSMGFSATFGCSFSLYFNTCKYARSEEAKKFRMKKNEEDEDVKRALLELTKRIQGIYGRFTPIVFRNQTAFSNTATGCRIGDPNIGPCPFSGVTACVDFCAHSHKDSVNMHGGLTLVVTLSKNRDLPFGKEPKEEQLHTLPFYALDNWDEHGDSGEIQRKFDVGALKKLTGFFTRSNIRKVPLKSCKAQAEMAKLEGLDKRKKSKDPAASTTPQSAKRRLFSDSLTQPTELPSRVFNNPNHGWSPAATEAPSIHEWYPHRPNPACSVPSFQNVARKALHFEVPPMPLSNSPCHAGYPAASVSQFQCASPFSQSAHQVAYSQSNYSSSPALHQVTYSQSNCTTSLARNNACNWLQPRAFGVQASSAFQACGGMQLNQSMQAKAFPNIENKFPNATFEFDSSVSYQQPPPLFDVRWDPSVNSHQSFKPVTPVSGYPAVKKEDPVVNFPWDVTPVGQPNTFVTHSPVYHAGSGYYTPERATGQSWPGHYNPMSCPPAPQGTPLHYQSQGYQQPGSAFSMPPKPHHMGSRLMSPSPASSPWPSMGSQPPRPASAPPAEGFEFEVQDSYNVEMMQDENVGGVAIALDHGSIYLEAAKYEVHATTAVPVPNPRCPTRISLVYYQHKSLNYAMHGRDVFLANKEKKAAAKREAAVLLVNTDV